MAKETRRDILTELNGHLAAAADCLFFIRDKEVADPDSISPDDSKWAKETHETVMKLLDQSDSRRTR